MKRFVFLDFDGVMNTPHYCNWLYHEGLPETDGYGTVFDPECVKYLESIIRKTDAEIVISSSWKDTMSYEQLLQMWNDRGLPGFVTDTTPTCSNHRGDEIATWLDLYSRESGESEYRYVIIDDLDATEFNDDQIENLVTVDWFYGLNESACASAIRILIG